MSLSQFKAKNHPQQVAVSGPDDDIDDRATHPTDFGPLNDRFGFTVDVAAARHNAKCKKYYTREQNGLAVSWAGEVVWCNPPFSDIAPWVRKAWTAWNQEDVGLSGAMQIAMGDGPPPVERIVMLLPANRTEQQWWQLMVEPFRDRPRSPLSVEFLPGRMRFMRRGQTAIGPNERPPFGCCLLIWQDPGVRDPLVWHPGYMPVAGLFEEVDS